MPELPEVEALRGFLAERTVGRMVVRVLPVAVSALKTHRPPLRALEGREVAAVRRHGKYLEVVTVDGPSLVAHLARGGRLRWRDPLPDGPPRPGGGLALRVALENGAGFDLAEAGSHKRLAVYVVDGPEKVPGVARLGPDPLADDFDRRRLGQLLRGERHRLKGALRDQTLIAGIGNAYSDEILHAARLSPYKPASSLTAAETERLHTALRDTLFEALERAKASTPDRLKAAKRAGTRVHGRTGEPCPVCGDTVREVSFSDSSLQYCPTCQTGGRILADRRRSRFLR
ncbi:MULTISPECIES: Fpg/Nei family DNA glycosylase [unclassified Streptomyces]|uniref:Fpg/Nei family DNA glycosylase n=1 Tax=unclassified Streptomyces TaxID=2593676 RepID=UPI00190770CC|nr:Fpg/Nei family DNA glycosylase [Streptomyces sp. HSG2]